MENWFDYYKDRRFVPIFFITLVVLCIIGPFVVGIIFQVADSYDLLKYWPFAAAWLGILQLALIGRRFARARDRRCNRYKSLPLSRDERAKAQSKLKTKPTFKSS